MKSSTTPCHPVRSEGSQCRQYFLEMLILFVPVEAEVGPCRIGCFYQFDFLSSQPALDGLFSGDCRGDVTECFIIDKRINVVLLSKTLYEFILMLMHSESNVVGQTDVKRAGSVGHDIHEVLVVCNHVLYCNMTLRSLPDSSQDFVRRLDSSAAPQNDKKDSFISYLCPCHPDLLCPCHPERSEGSHYFRYYSNASVAYTPPAFRFFVSLRSAQNDKLGRSAQICPRAKRRNDRRRCSDRHDRRRHSTQACHGAKRRNDRLIPRQIKKRLEDK
jgi:hypothetical protein